MEEFSQWEKLHLYITEVTEEICGKRKNDKRQAWMTMDILDKVNEGSKLKNKDSKEEYRKLCREIQKECRKAKEDHYKKFVH